jgi:hypothetical protein
MTLTYTTDVDFSFAAQTNSRLYNITMEIAANSLLPISFEA